MADSIFYFDESEDEMAYDQGAAFFIALLGLDADLATFSLPANTTISAFGATLVDDANAAAVLATLGLTTVASNSHARQHSITSTDDHTFPGGSVNFLRADGTFAAPPGSGGGGTLPGVEIDCGTFAAGTADVDAGSFV
jgi:hypothetical protein